MAITESRTLPAPFIEELGKDYGKQLTNLTKDPLKTSQFQPELAAQDTLQTQAATLAGTSGKGIGAFEPYVASASGYSGPQGYKDFMSPYQQQVIDATMTAFDQQAAMQRRGISDQAKTAGAYGGARMGVQESIYDSQSDMNRAQLLAGLNQQNFEKHKTQRTQRFNNNKD